VKGNFFKCSECGWEDNARNQKVLSIVWTGLYWMFKDWIFLMWPIIPLYLAGFIVLFWKDLKKEWVGFLRNPGFSLPLTIYLFARLHGGPVGEVVTGFNSLWFVFAPLWFYLVFEGMKKRGSCIKLKCRKANPKKMNPVANGFKWALLAFIFTFGALFGAPNSNAVAVLAMIWIGFGFIGYARAGGFKRK